MVEQANLDKQIKRHVVARRHGLFAITLPGLEMACRDELQSLGQGVVVEEVVRGGVTFSGRLADLYRANLHLHSAGRILLRLADFKATNFDQLTLKLGTIPWSWYLPRGCLPHCRVTTRHSRLYHSQAVAQRALDVVDRYWRGQGAAAAGDFDQKLFIRLEDDRVALSLDSSGENLYRRGFKRHSARAPVRETLAAAILWRAGYQSEMPLIDPMCGAGTFALEAALMVKQIAPGVLRDFAFMQWPAFRPRQWDHLKSVAARTQRQLARPLILASDVDHAACGALWACVQRHGLADAVQVVCRDFFDFSPADLPEHMRSGLLVLNPPYGVRLKPEQELQSLYRRIGRKMRSDFRGWRTAVLVPHPDLVRYLPSELVRTSITHGGLPLVLLTGQIL
jgi:putative N6-adenine-specific DNA methylase